MLGEKLKKQRQSLGLTQQEVADHLHVSRQTISNWEVGRNFPDIPMIISISDYYQISLDELLKGDEQLMDKMKKDAELIKRTKRRKIFDAAFVVILLLTVLFAFVMSRIPELANQRISQRKVRADNYSEIIWCRLGDQSLSSVRVSAVDRNTCSY